MKNFHVRRPVHPVKSVHRGILGPTYVCVDGVSVNGAGDVSSGNDLYVHSHAHHVNVIIGQVSLSVSVRGVDVTGTGLLCVGSFHLGDRSRGEGTVVRCVLVGREGWCVYY